MAVHDKIKVNEYNDIRTKVVQVLGTGSGTFGYGQALKSSAVSVSNRVSVNDWANLQYDIINAYVHQNGSSPNIPSAVENELIRYSTTTSSSASPAWAPVTYWDGVATDLQTNRWNINYASQSITVNHGSGSQTWPGSLGTSWGVSNNVQAIVTAEWTSAAAARYFFNTASYVQFGISRTGGSSTSQNTSWSSILTSASYASSWGGNIPSPIGAAANLNFYACTNSFSNVYQTVTGSSPYGSNTFTVQARTPDVANNSAGTASKVEFRLLFNDGYVDPDIISGHPATDNPPDGSVDGTITVSPRTVEAFGTMQPAPGAGNFQVESPTITISFSLV